MESGFDLCVQIIVVFLCYTVSAADISCRNEAGEPVDWWVWNIQFREVEAVTVSWAFLNLLWYKLINVFCLFLCSARRLIIYKLPMYKISEVGSGVDYMYLDSRGGSWQMSKYLVNTSQGALAQTLNQLYLGKAYQVRLHPCFLDFSGYQNLLKHSFVLLSGHSGCYGELNPRLGSWPFCLAFYCFFTLAMQPIFVLALCLSVAKKNKITDAIQNKQNLSLSPTVQSTPSTMMPLQCWTTSKDTDTPKVQHDSSSLFFSLSQRIPKLVLASPQSKGHIGTDVDREHVCC